MNPLTIVGLGVGVILAASLQNPYFWYVLIGVAMITLGIWKYEKVIYTQSSVIESERYKKTETGRSIEDEWTDSSGDRLSGGDSDSLTDQNRPGATTHH